MKVRHPAPVVMTRYLRHMADLIADQGDQAISQAVLLSSRGWPASVVGDGRGNTTASSTEQGALATDDWAGIDTTLATQMRSAWKSLLDLEGTMSRLLSRADDNDPIPAGTGHCLRCDTFCRPDARRPHNRIRSGFCPACDTAWHRANKPPRGEFIHAYRTALSQQTA